MSAHLQSFFKGAQGLKLKELAPYAAKYYRENLTYSKLRPQIAQGLDEYQLKHIDTGSITPLVHVMWGVFFLSYAIAWPGEYRHMKAEEAAKLEGKQGH